MDLFCLALMVYVGWRYMKSKSETQAPGSSANRATPPSDNYRQEFAALADEVNVYRQAYADKARAAGIDPRALNDSWMVVGESYEEARIEAVQKNFKASLDGMRSAVAAARAKAEGPLPAELLGSMA